MKSNKVITSVLAMSLCMSFLCCGCADTKKNNRHNGDETEEETEVELPENEVLVVTGHRNEAWGHHSSLTYILSDGRVYSSNESFEGYPQYFNGGISLDERLSLLEKYTDPMFIIEEKDIKKIYSNMLKIDTEAEFKYSEECCCDAGTGFTYVYLDGNSIQISESGDRNGELDDRYARKTDKLVDLVLDTRSGERIPANVYSGNETYIDTLKCPGEVSGDRRRIITNIEELKAFEKDTGIDIRSIDSFEYFGDPDYDAFNYVCIAVEIFDYHVRYKPVEANAFIVSEDYVGFASLEDPEIDMSKNQAPVSTYCYIAQVPNYYDGNLDDYNPFLESV